MLNNPFHPAQKTNIFIEMICHSYKDKSFDCHIFSLAGKAYSDQPWISSSFKSHLWLEQVQSPYPSCSSNLLISVRLEGTLQISQGTVMTLLY